jgi:hypothetical protein
MTETCEINRPRFSPSLGINSTIILIGINMANPSALPEKQRQRFPPTVEATNLYTGSTEPLPGNSRVQQANWSSREPDDFEEVMGAFYQKLLVSQKPMNPIMEEALYSNLWDLYSYADNDPGQ